MKERTNEIVFALRDSWYAEAKKQTLGTLRHFLDELAGFEHDYNTICYACAAAGVAATWAMDRTEHGGITGFQAGAIMWEYMQAWNGVEPPAWLLKGEDMLFPQYAYKFNTINTGVWEWLRNKAVGKLEDKAAFPAHEEVIAHWQSIRDGKIPFGYALRD